MAVKKKKPIAKVGPISNAIRELSQKKAFKQAPQVERSEENSRRSLFGGNPIPTEAEKLMYLALFRTGAALHMRDQVEARKIVDDAQREIHVKYTYIAQEAFGLTVEKK